MRDECKYNSQLRSLNGPQHPECNYLSKIDNWTTKSSAQPPCNGRNKLDNITTRQPFIVRNKTDNKMTDTSACSPSHGRDKLDNRTTTEITACPPFSGGNNISSPSCSSPIFRQPIPCNRHSWSPVDIPSYGDLPTSFKSKSSHNRYSYGPDITRNNLVDLETKVNQYFDKRFYFNPPIENWNLPQPNQMFTSSKWQIKALQLMKLSLNCIKNKLNDYNLDDWHRHTRSMNKAGEIQWKLRKEYSPEFVTQAWCKLYENLMSFILVPSISIAETNSFNSAHLCEAPGAFVTALNHYLKTYHPGISWRWMATTLNPYYEGNPLSSMINDDRFILQTLPHWNFGVDFTGNLMDLNNMTHLVNEAKSMGDVRLVTADGSIDCQEDPGEQEVIVASLHYCEAVTALHMLAEGGNLLLKMFTFYECDSVCLMYLLCCAFKSVVVNKPATSKEGNSEVYVVCMDYRGRTTIEPWLAVLRIFYGPERPPYPMFLRDSIPASFIAQLEDCAKQFKGYQTEVILNNIRTFHGKDRDKRFMVKKLRYMVAEHFMYKYEIKRLNDEDEVVGKSRLNEVSTLNMDPRSEEGSFNDKRRRALLEPLALLEALGDDIENMGITWPYGDDLIKWLTFPVRLQSFEIETGKPVKKVASSKFCLGRLLKIRNQVKDIANSQFYYDAAELVLLDSSLSDTLTCVNNSDGDGEESQLNTTHTNDAEEENAIKNGSLPLLRQLEMLFPGSTVLDFKTLLWSSLESGSNQQAEKEAFQEIKEVIDELWRENTLILVGYPMLTQFNVGMVYMLSHLFEEVGFVKPHKQDFAVVFKSFRHWDVHMRKFLDTVESTIETAKFHDRNVLALLPINILCGNNDYEASSEGSVASDNMCEDGPRTFYTCVTETNHLCVKEQALDIISTVRGRNSIWL